MAKSPRVTFRMERIAADDWQIIAECPGVETVHIKGAQEQSGTLTIGLSGRPPQSIGCARRATPSSPNLPIIERPAVEDHQDRRPFPLSRPGCRRLKARLLVGRGEARGRCPRPGSMATNRRAFRRTICDASSFKNAGPWPRADHVLFTDEGRRFARAPRRQMRKKCGCGQT